MTKTHPRYEAEENKRTPINMGKPKRSSQIATSPPPVREKEGKQVSHYIQPRESVRAFASCLSEKKTMEKSESERALENSSNANHTSRTVKINNNQKKIPTAHDQHYTGQKKVLCRICSHTPLTVTRVEGACGHACASGCEHIYMCSQPREHKRRTKHEACAPHAM